MNQYEILALDYNAEADELDLLVNSAVPNAAESLPLDEGIYARRDFESGEITGAMIRGYAGFARKVASDAPLSFERSRQMGLVGLSQAIIQWQRDVGTLSHELASHIGKWPPQDQLLELWAKATT